MSVGPAPKVPADRRRAILRDGADDSPVLAIRRAERLGRMTHVGASSETAWAEAVERMAESVDAVAINFGHGSVAPSSHVAGHQRTPSGSPGRRGVAAVGAVAAGRASHDGAKPWSRVPGRTDRRSWRRSRRSVNGSRSAQHRADAGVHARVAEHLHVVGYSRTAHPRERLARSDAALLVSGTAAQRATWRRGPRT